MYSVAGTSAETPLHDKERCVVFASLMEDVFHLQKREPKRSRTMPTVHTSGEKPALGITLSSEV